MSTLVLKNIVKLIEVGGDGDCGYRALVHASAAMTGGTKSIEINGCSGSHAGWIDLAAGPNRQRVCAVQAMVAALARGIFACQRIPVPTRVANAPGSCFVQEHVQPSRRLY